MAWSIVFFTALFTQSSHGLQSCQKKKKADNISGGFAARNDGESGIGKTACFVICPRNPVRRTYQNMYATDTLPPKPRCLPP